MKKYFKKIIAGFLVLSIVATSVTTLAPKPAYAVLGVGDVVTDPGNTFQGVVNATENGITSTVTSALGIKTFTLDAIAVAIAKQILQQLTLSVVNWINSGFSGSPAFVQNPAGFFTDIGDRIAGSFLQANGDLRFLCSPFSLDIRIALAIKMQGQIAQKYTCTLSGAIKNATTAVKGASITGFVQGDFSQGGFPAFFSLTTDPQNNAGGAFLQAEDDLAKKISKQVNQKTNELAQGHGFLSWEQCTYSRKDAATGAKVPVSESDYKAASTMGAGAPAALGVSSECTTQTPGDVISATLNEHLAVPTRELELANDINAIINALFTQLVSQVLQLGLGAISGNSGSSAGSAYLQSLAASSQQQNQALIDKTAEAVSSYIGPAQQLKGIKDSAVALVDATRGATDATIACWRAYPSNTAQTLPSGDTVVPINEINNIQSIYDTQVAPLQAQAISEDAKASSTLTTLLAIQNSAASSVDVSALNSPAQQLQNLATTNSIPSATDVLHAQTAFDTLSSTLDPINKKITQSYNKCKSLPPAGQ